ncbi:MAG: bacteriohemerythrin [Bryobacteraceae bacterium]|jgi:hemerythrin
MQLLEWSDKSSVGIPELDAQHRHLLELLNELLQRMQAGESEGATEAARKELMRCAESHLQREELVLRVRGYPGYAQHKAEHDGYRARFASLAAHADRGDFSVRLSNFVAEWWRFHVLTSDQQYARFFRIKSKT